MLLIDTNILIDYLRQRPEAVELVDRYGKANLALSPIVVMEIFPGRSGPTGFPTYPKGTKWIYGTGC